MKLPIDDVLPEVTAELRRTRRLVLQAPPGAGKTTKVPLALMEAGFDGRIIMLEPRRLAARSAAARMAETLGEAVGQRVGYRVRGAQAISKHTQVEVVTEGILTRMLQQDPELPGVGTVIFDEFHERSLNADLGLALCLEVAGTLREDLNILVMSATLDADPIAQMIDAPMVTAEGRAFPVTPYFLTKPRHKDVRLETAITDLTLTALATHEGSALVFLPGEAEIRRAEKLLSAQLPRDCTLAPLFGAMDFEAQQAALRPLKKGRKVVLATAIAETSLTIPDISIVVDAGLSRRALFDAASAMSRLVTEKASRAEATQRAGRAGRVMAGHCYKLWTKGEDGARAAFPPAEIEVGDLAGLALELAVWGTAPQDLSFVTHPHPGRYEGARALLHMLDAVDASGRITAHGRALAALPLHPRLAHMLVRGGTGAAEVAALLAERDILRGVGTDLSLRLNALKTPNRFGGALHHGALARVRQEAKRLSKHTAPNAPRRSTGGLAALAYPDRIGLRRPGDAPRYALSGGKGAHLPEGDALAKARLIVATDLDGDPREARIRQAVALGEAELRDIYGAQIRWHAICAWSKREGRVLTRQQEQFGALVLEDRAWRDAPPEDIAKAMLDGVRQLGVHPAPKAARFLARARLMDPENWSNAALNDSLEEWLLPHLLGVRTAADWKAFDLTQPLKSRLSWDEMQRLDAQVPAAFTTPLGRSVPIDYSGQAPEIAVRLQELFGVTAHPSVAGQPLKLTLLSPAHRPIQITMDLPGFWRSSYHDVRKDMRSQYPKHPWPEDPTSADPTVRAKPRNRTG